MLFRSSATATTVVSLAYRSIQVRRKLNRRNHRYDRYEVSNDNGNCFASCRGLDLRSWRNRYTTSVKNYLASRLASALLVLASIPGANLAHLLDREKQLRNSFHDGI